MENLVYGLCQGIKSTHSLVVISAFAPPGSCKEGSVYRPKLPGLLPFFCYGLCKGALFLRQNPSFEIILGGGALVAPLVLLLAKVFCRKSLVLVHGLDLIYPNLLYQSFFVRWLKYCDGVVANSRYTASLAEKKGVKKDSIYIIPPGVGENLLGSLTVENAKKQFGLEGRKVLLSVGRLAKRKGIKEFLQNCFAKIVREVPEVCFVVVGDNPRESMVHRDDVKGELRTIVQDMRLGDQVKLVGWLEKQELAMVYRASDLMVLPALPIKDDVEGFGIVILEAARAGVPTVASRVGGIPDAVEDGRSGILLEPGDYKLMSQTIVTLLRDDQRRSALGKYAASRIEERYSWTSVVQKYEELFRSLAQ